MIKRGLKDVKKYLYIDKYEEEGFYKRIILKCNMFYDYIKILNKIVLEKDYGVEPFVYIDLYYLDEKNEVIINPYDDRGVDIIITKDNAIKDKIMNFLNKRFENLKIEIFYKEGKDFYKKN